MIVDGEHNTMGEDCWCNPRVEVMQNGNKVIIHNDIEPQEAKEMSNILLAIASETNTASLFQCPSGHFLIQTAFFSLPPGAQKTPAGRLFLQIPTHYTHFWASMPSFLPSHPSKQPVFAPPGAAGAMLRTPPPRKPIFWQNQGGGAQIPPAAAK